MNKIGMVVLAYGALNALAAERIVQRGDVFAVSNETAVAETEVLRMMYGARGVDKAGSGVYTLPRGQVDSPDPLAVNALEGAVVVTDGGTLPTPTAPTAVLNMANFWLDAAVNRETNANGKVIAWYDCRETKTGDSWGADYARAKTILEPKNASGVYAPVMPTATTPEGQSLPMIHFGGYTTGTGMNFFKKDSTTAEVYSSIRHVYAVVNFQKGYGYPLGANGKLLLHPSAFATETLDSSYNSGDTYPFAVAGEFLVNGARCNPMHTFVKKGLQLIELHAAGDVPMESFGRIFNDRNVAGRYGGDYIGEILVFDGESKALDAAERLQVSRYLMHKWGIAPARGRTTVRLGETASLRPSAAGTAVAGRGTVERSGAETEHYRPTAAAPALGVKVHLGVGPMKADVRELDLAVRPGEALSLATDSWGVHTVTSGEAAPGEASVTGASEAVRLGRIDAGVKTLTVGAKQVVLGDSGVGGERLAAEAGAATIPNGSFESGFSDADWVWVKKDGSSGIKTFSVETDVLDWRIAGDGADMAKFKTTYRYARFMPTDGVKALLLKQVNLLYAHVNVMKDGDYMLSFDGTGRYKYDNMQLVLSLVDAAEKTNTFACCTLPIGAGFRPFRFSLPGLKAGVHKLVIETKNGKAFATTTDSHAMLDNFRLSFVSDGPSTIGGVAVPNGSFENTRITSAKRDVTAFGTNDVTGAGWTLTCPGAPTAGEISFVSRLMKDYFVPSDRNQGEWQLRFHSNAGRATSAAFALPAGLWTLRCKAAKWAFDGVVWNKVMSRNYSPRVAVRVFKNGVEAFDASSADLKTYGMTDVNFPNVLAVETGDRIVLEVRQPMANAIVNVDDFEFVPAGTWGTAAELVKDGTFAGGNANWTVTGAVYAKTLNGGYEQHYGGQRCDDDKAVCLVNNGAVSQDIAFPAAGVYRLSFWARSRVSHYAGADKPNSREFGGNVLRASLIVGNATNALVETLPVFSTNFNQTVALFRVPSAGTHKLRIEGLNNPGAGVWTGGNKSDSNVFLDCVSVMLAPGAGTAPVLPEELELKLTGDSKLRLDYVGEASVHKLTIGAKRFYGRVDAAVAPGLVTGTGVLNVTGPKPGVILIVR